MLAATVDIDALLMPFFKIAFDILAVYKFTHDWQKHFQQLSLCKINIHLFNKLPNCTILLSPEVLI